jgi:tetratricopeptide (TPR) repeat protein
LPAQRKDLLARVGDDQAVRQAVEAGDYAKAEELLEDAARRRTLAAAEVCAAQARLQEVQLRYAKAAALLPEESKEERLLCLREAGCDLERIGKHTEEVSIFEQMLALYQELGDRKQERTTLNHISCLHRKQGNYAAALSHLEQSLRISHEIGHRNQRVATLYTMLYLHGVQGDHPAFLRCRELIRQENGGNEAINFMDDIMWNAGGMRKAKHMLGMLERSESILRVV